MPQLPQHPHLERTQSKIFYRFSVRRLLLRLGPKHKYQPLNFSLSLSHRSAIRLPLPHLRIGMSVIIGAILFHPCNPMSGVLIRPFNTHLCLVLEAMYGGGPPAIPRVLLLASSHRRQATRKPKKTTCLGTSGVVSSRHRLVLFYTPLSALGNHPRIVLSLLSSFYQGRCQETPSYCGGALSWRRPLVRQSCYVCQAKFFKPCWNWRRQRPRRRTTVMWNTSSLRTCLM